LKKIGECLIFVNNHDRKSNFQSKTEMLDNLLEIEVAYSMLKGGDAGEDPIDAHFKKLHTAMEVSSKG
jgi:poly [ADP-ribose] polymerase